MVSVASAISYVKLSVASAISSAISDSIYATIGMDWYYPCLFVKV